jgi:hypothetical protein
MFNPEALTNGYSPSNTDGSIVENGKPISLLEKRARAFLAQKYPLTNKGEALRRDIAKNLNDGQEKRIDEIAINLPTVENPQLHLFKDLECTLEQEEKLFGWDLANIQSTAGCSHDCVQCSIPPAPKLTIMPFAAILKIAEKKKDQDAKKDDLWNSWTEFVKNGTGINLEDLPKEYAHSYGFRSFYIFAEKTYPSLIPFFKSEYVNHPIKFALGKEMGLVDLSRKLVLNKFIVNYYNNDVFDYFDKSFPHEDGAPADYGDVFTACASDIRPIHITTAGWNRKNKIAQKAAEKIINKCRENPRLKDMIRISISHGERNARRNLDDYRENMKEVIAILMQTSSVKSRDKIIFYSDPREPEDNEFIEKVVSPLQSYIVNKHMPVVIVDTPISRFSGRLASDTSRDDHDGSCCQPGVHIWPDGTIAYQAYTFSENGSMEIKKGERPKSTGTYIYKLNDQVKL